LSVGTVDSDTARSDHPRYELGVVELLARIAQEILGAGEERILNQNAADHRDRMGAEDVDRKIGVHQVGVIGADHRVVIVGQHLVE
jgi:hypothetical protein